MTDTPIRLRHDTVTDLEVRTSAAGTVVELTLANADSAPPLTSSDLPAPVADALRTWLDPIPTGRRAAARYDLAQLVDARRRALLDALVELDRVSRNAGTLEQPALALLRERIAALLPAETPDA